MAAKIETAKFKPTQRKPQPITGELDFADKNLDPGILDIEIERLMTLEEAGALDAKEQNKLLFLIQQKKDRTINDLLNQFDQGMLDEQGQQDLQDLIEEKKLQTISGTDYGSLEPKLIKADKAYAQDLSLIRPILDVSDEAGKKLQKKLIEKHYGPLGLAAHQDSSTGEWTAQYSNKQQHTLPGGNPIEDLKRFGTSLAGGLLPNLIPGGGKALGKVAGLAAARIAGAGGIEGFIKQRQEADAYNAAVEMGLLKPEEVKNISKKTTIPFVDMQIPESFTQGAIGGVLGQGIAGELLPAIPGAIKGVGQYLERAGTRGAQEQAIKKELQDIYFEEQAIKTYKGKEATAGEILKNSIEKKIQQIKDKAFQHFDKVRRSQLNLVGEGGLSPDLADFRGFWEEFSTRFQDRPDIQKGMAKALGIGVGNVPEQIPNTGAKFIVERIDEKTGKITRDLYFKKYPNQRELVNLDEGYDYVFTPELEIPKLDRNYDYTFTPEQTPAFDFAPDEEGYDYVFKDLSGKEHILSPEQFNSLTKEFGIDTTGGFSFIPEKKEGFTFTPGKRESYILTPEQNLEGDFIPGSGFLESMTKWGDEKFFPTKKITNPPSFKEVIPGAVNDKTLETLGSVTPQGYADGVQFLSDLADKTQKTDPFLFREAVAAKVALTKPLQKENSYLIKNLKQEVTDLDAKATKGQAIKIGYTDYGESSLPKLPRFTEPYVAIKLGLDVLSEGYKQVPVSLRKLIRQDDPLKITQNIFSKKQTKNNAQILNKIIDDTVSPLEANKLKQDIATSYISNKINNAEVAKTQGLLSGVSDLSSKELQTIFADTVEKQKAAQAQNIPLDVNKLYSSLQQKTKEKEALGIMGEKLLPPTKITNQEKDFITNLVGKSQYETASMPLNRLLISQQQVPTEPTTKINQTKSFFQELGKPKLGSDTGVGAGVGTLVGGAAGIVAGNPLAGAGLGGVAGGLIGANVRPLARATGSFIQQIPEAISRTPVLRELPSFVESPVGQMLGKGITAGTTASFVNPEEEQNILQQILRTRKFTNGNY